MAAWSGQQTDRGSLMDWHEALCRRYSCKWPVACYNMPSLHLDLRLSLSALPVCSFKSCTITPVKDGKRQCGTPSREAQRRLPARLTCPSPCVLHRFTSFPAPVGCACCSNL
ncbi:unnamed protein product [Polarella glacialis]|uniref:Uncharacterized protein n=1 Tax=Polarella glacialis TaxID=89957 RepID=A0A813DVC1_POLGL|nr:unnamed protein product [Polarella glacialis]